MSFLCIKELWLALGRGLSQLQESKLTNYHFDEDAFSRTKVNLAMQVLCFLVASVICAAIKDDEIESYLNNKAMYNHLAGLCENWNTVVAF
jgi:hypothetical protein